MLTRKKVLTQSRPLKILYPYNEHLPCNRAHDVYVFQNCASLAYCGIDTTLICGHRSIKNLGSYYLGQSTPQLNFKTGPLIRKSLFGISWNLPFFWWVQNEIQKSLPTHVISSVLKQGFYHAKRRIPGVRYIYEVHELALYPGQKRTKKFFQEREMLSLMDLIIVTTEQLKKILERPPYCLTNRIEVVELAVERSLLKPKPLSFPFKLLYVGQLYKEQGVEDLVATVSQIEECELHIVGGRAGEIEALKKRYPKVHYHGFLLPSQIEPIAKMCHACVAPFELRGRMPFVAHTKLHEYAQWGLPFLAPNCSIVSEHFNRGVVTFLPGRIKEGIQKLIMDYTSLSRNLQETPYDYSWQTRAKNYRTLIESV